VTAALRVGSRAADDVAAARRRAGARMLDLKGAPVVALPEHVRAAARAALEAPGERPSRGLMVLREALTAMLADQTELRLNPETEVVVTQGAMQAVNLVLRTLLLDRGGNVVVPTPGFFFPEMVRRAGGQVRAVRCEASAGWALDVSAVAAAMDEATRAILIANPANPTGWMPTAEHLAQLAALAAERGAVLISDESYARFAYPDADPGFTSVLSTWGSSVILVGSLSKSHALGDWRVGYVAACAPLADAVTATLEWECLHCAALAQVVAASAVAGPQDWIEAALAPYAGARDAVLEAVRANPWLDAGRPPATPFLFVDASRIPAAPARFIEAGVPVVSGVHFEAPGYVRVPFGGTPGTIDELAAALQGVRPRA
jgi:aminotransferase